MKINSGLETVNVGIKQASNDYRTSDVMNIQKKVEVDSADELKSEKQLNKDKDLSDEIISQAIEQANQSLKKHNRVIEVSIHDKTHAVMYTIKDSVTNEVIGEFPPKKIQDMIAKMWELAGIFVDEEA